LPNWLPSFEGPEKEVARPINPTVYQRDEFIERGQQGSQLATGLECRISIALSP
jgi:hypothetical protein